MEQQACNPYLPKWEYVPDGEPHVFDGRIYIFGSHDRFGGNFYCEKDYTVWSAPVDDLSRWRCEGVSYLDDWESVSFDDKRKVVDILISQIDATSESVTIHWKI